MKKSHTFKGYQVPGIDEVYNIKVSVNDYVLSIQLTDIDGNKDTEKFLLNELMHSITKVEAERFMNQWFSCSLDLKELK